MDFPLLEFKPGVVFYWISMIDWKKNASFDKIGLHRSRALCLAWPPLRSVVSKRDGLSATAVFPVEISGMRLGESQAGK